MTVLDTALTFLPEIFLLAGALLIFLCDTLGLRRIELVGSIAVATVLLTLLLVFADLGFAPIAALATIPSSQIDAAPGGGQPLYWFTSLGLFFQLFFLFAAFLVALASMSRPSYERGAPVFFGLLLLATLGMMLVAVSSDLIFLLLAIEIVSIPSYLLVAYTRRGARSMEAAMKFYIIGALSTVLSFFGASLLFGAYGSTNLFVLAAGPVPAGQSALVLIGYALLIAGLAFKITLVPFHAWAVDVYDGAPDDVSAFLAGGTKKIGLFAFFLVFLGPVILLNGVITFEWLPGLGAVSLGPMFQVTLSVLAVVTMTVGNVLALMQKSMKRMLAYSSISQAGYMLIGIAIGTPAALTGASLQVFAHVFMKSGAFLVVAAAATLGIGPWIADWKGMGQRRPYLALAFAVMLLSLAGVPLTVGFISKFVLFSAAVNAQGYFVWLAVAGLLNSALSVFYYGRVLKVIYFDAPGPAVPLPSANVAPNPVAKAGSALLGFAGIGYARGIAIAVAAAVIVLMGVYPGPILQPLGAAAQHFWQLWQPPV
ncbi:MAG: NADH-quinone oxidoreductase subunit N [Thermoplasmata archaeon]